MARRSEHSFEELKAMITDVAENIIVEEGLLALNLRTIAAEIGYSVGSVYMVFVNRADLLMHINARTLDAITVALSQEPSIEAMAMAYLRYASQNFNRWRMILDQPLPVGTKIPAWYQRKADALFAPIEAHFAKLAPGSPKAYRKRAAWALGCGVQGICALSLSAKQDKSGVKDAEAMIALLVRHFMQGWQH